MSKIVATLSQPALRDGLKISGSSW